MVAPNSNPATTSALILSPAPKDSGESKFKKDPNFSSLGLSQLLLTALSNRCSDPPTCSLALRLITKIRTAFKRDIDTEGSLLFRKSLHDHILRLPFASQFSSEDQTQLLALAYSLEVDLGLLGSPDADPANYPQVMTSKTQAKRVANLHLVQLLQVERLVAETLGDGDYRQNPKGAWTAGAGFRVDLSIGEKYVNLEARPRALVEAYCSAMFFPGTSQCSRPVIHTPAHVVVCGNLQYTTLFYNSVNVFKCLFAQKRSTTIMSSRKSARKWHCRDHVGIKHPSKVLLSAFRIIAPLDGIRVRRREGDEIRAQPRPAGR